MSVREAEEYIDVMEHADPDTLIRYVTGLLQQEKSLIALNDVAIVASSPDAVENREPEPPRRLLLNTDHCFDYANVVGYWLRNYDHPQQMKSPYYTALFVSDTMKFIRNAKKDPAAELQSRPEEHAGPRRPPQPQGLPPRPLEGLRRTGRRLRHRPPRVLPLARSRSAKS